MFNWQSLDIGFGIIPFIVLMTLFIVICYYALVKKNAIPTYWKFFIPLLGVLFIFFHFMWIGRLAGSPIHGFPENQFLYIKHRMVAQNVELWVFESEKGSKLYVFPATDENRKKLARAAQRAKEGGKIKGKFKRRGRKPEDRELELLDNVGNALPSKDYSINGRRIEPPDQP